MTRRWSFMKMKYYIVSQNQWFLPVKMAGDGTGNNRGVWYSLFCAAQKIGQKTMYRYFTQILMLILEGFKTRVFDAKTNIFTKGFTMYDPNNLQSPLNRPGSPVCGDPAVAGTAVRMEMAANPRKTCRRVRRLPRPSSQRKCGRPLSDCPCQRPSRICLFHRPCSRASVLPSVAAVFARSFVFKPITCV